jgi:hypothetical protein
MEQQGQQQQQQQQGQQQLQEQAGPRAQLIRSLPQLLAGEGSVSVAAAAVSRLPVDVCAGYLDLPEADRREVVLELARGGEWAVMGLCCAWALSCGSFHV